MSIIYFYLFSVCAFHLKFDEMKLDNNVAKWAVNVLEISRTRRHLDRATLMVFWEKLDRYILIYYNYLNIFQFTNIVEFRI